VYLLWDSIASQRNVCPGTYQTSVPDLIEPNCTKDEQQILRTICKEVNGEKGDLMRLVRKRWNLGLDLSSHYYELHVYKNKCNWIHWFLKFLPGL
jgi:hypothetical protein